MAPPQEKSVQIAQLFLPEIKELLNARDFVALKKLFKSSLSAIDLADVWSHFSSTEKSVLFQLLSDRAAVTLFQELDPDEQSQLLNSLNDAGLEKLIHEFLPQEAARLFNKLPEKKVRSLMKFLEKDPQGEPQTLIKYPPHSVGNWMHIQRVDLKSSLTTHQALTRIQTSTRLRKGGGPDGYYVTDKMGKIVGFVSLRELLAAPTRTRISEFMSPVRLLRLYPKQDLDEAIQLFTKYKLSMSPIVDEEDKLLGYIQAEDIISLVQKEFTADIQKLGAVEVLDEPYFKIAFRRMIQKRGTWLCVLFFGEMLTATAMAFFQGEIEKAVVLALFIPLIISSGGNSGSQASSLVVRALALKEVTLKDWWHVVKREFAAGLVLGSILGSIGFLRIFIWSQLSPIYGPHYFSLALTVGAALVLVILWGTLSGSLLPLILRRIGFDPAVASAPFVATLVDVTGLIIYFLTASIILKGTLL